jgi:Ca2+-binding EF-hand superfamily protein
MRDSVIKSVRPLGELMSKHDSNKDGALDYNELENLFLELQLAFKPNMFARVCEHILEG